MAKIRNGLTLIEVVAAMVLLASAVTTLITVQGRTLNQLRDAREQALAADLARELTTQWKLRPKGFVPPVEGVFEDQPGWHWTLRNSPWTNAVALKLTEITLYVIKHDQSGNRTVLTLHWLENPVAP